ncbi:hypothetical protein BVRB_009590 [Beta vulgaris subsp. vulgaris]|uniref:Uncharacterized protein n=1 Tax=Beta vulgaris subsp. vulgaris TaxID=3555 RepID=A0A0J8DWR8_BETVV|nr:hypothetical protein BVRB_009590 [Beta vulgaris subsp. vulgaris]
MKMWQAIIDLIEGRIANSDCFSVCSLLYASVVTGV